MVFLSFAFLSPTVVLVFTLSEAGRSVQVLAGAWLSEQITSAAHSSSPWVGMSSFFMLAGRAEPYLAALRQCSDPSRVTPLFPL